MRLRRTRSGTVEGDLAPAEVSVLATVAADLLELLTSDEPATEQPADPLERLTGLSSRPVPPPDDPALRRLLPDAYRVDAFGEQDPRQAAAASAEFRRFTDSDLRAGKRAAADRVLETLAPVAESGVLRLTRDDVDAWLTFLTDARLVLGTRLHVTEDTLDEPLGDEDDPRTYALHVYSWLGWLQETLLANVEPRPH
jgi:hypothetical protein